LKKSSNDLPEFNPNATYVHPLSRPKAKNFKQGDRSSRSSRVSRSVEAESVPASEEEEASADDEGEDDEEYEDDEEDRARTPPRSVRPTTRKELPYSPKKTRSTRVVVIDSDSEASGKSSQNHQSFRRSTRSRKAAEIVLVSDDDSDGEYNSRARKVNAQPARKKRHVKSVQPMYGHFRDISTLDEDPFSDDEEREVLRRHRKVCEKCYQSPAHVLLEQFRKKSKRKGKKRKRGTDDEFEESEDDDSYIGMGGWVQW
jgi:chromodomain-helicase-DNA-binding protein 4